MPRLVLVIAVVVAVAVVVVAGACATAPAHVQLASPPDRSAPLAERRAFYEAHRPVAVRAPATMAPSGGLDGPLFLVLEDGTRVDAAEDLLTNVDEGSPSAQAIARADTADRAAAAWNTVGAVVSAAGVVVAASSFVPAALSGSDPNRVDSLYVGLALLAGGGVVTMAGIATIVAGGALTMTATEEKAVAMRLYDRALRARLGLVDNDVAGLPGTWAPATDGSGDIALAAPAPATP